MIKFIRNKERKKKKKTRSKGMTSAQQLRSLPSKDLMCVGKLNKGMWEGRNHHTQSILRPANLSQCHTDQKQTAL